MQAHAGRCPALLPRTNRLSLLLLPVSSQIRPADFFLNLPLFRIHSESVAQCSGITCDLGGLKGLSETLLLSSSTIRAIVSGAELYQALIVGNFYESN